MKVISTHIWSAVNVALGALTFLILLPGAFFWIGFACAAAALILGTKSKKSPLKSKQICAVAGISLAVAGAICLIIVMYSAGYRYVEIL